VIIQQSGLFVLNHAAQTTSLWTEPGGCPVAGYSARSDTT